MSVFFVHSIIDTPCVFPSQIVFNDLIIMVIANLSNSEYCYKMMFCVEAADESLDQAREVFCEIFIDSRPEAEQ